ncbi:nucleotidyltransferase [Desulfotomaculum arcticum]|uniref:Nucleotidyltransferase n=1 Tax=Desulfotruncus arcticus DSM 17038 TaxID=1121424 RepID=A0A1I2N2F3_9FIRM|nr:sugar phosphate nucleotidyltransferase [Desulfotruncus arcticus]SFF97039.1 nucleotidyltransferase [Desulfotomaculum arcticum] [Desulfotruncus arcticus DSM 17038]
MKAIIMAGGEGSRLRPLTCGLPKPMVPIMNRPIMTYIADLLNTHGFSDIGVTLQYMPEEIRNYFGNGSEFNANMQYFIEETPLGTAGSVKNAEKFLDSPFIVISGDALTDFDLAKAVSFHREKGSIATLVLTRVSCPLEYGVVITGRDGSITQFLEKPSWGEVFSDTVNTGIYILEPEVLDYIPPNTKFDFSKDLFPLLLEMGKPMYGVVLSGYWCDIGDLRQYVQAHYDFLSGSINLKIHAEEQLPGVFVERGVKIDATAQINGPVFIGEAVNIGKNVRIDQFTSIGSGTLIQEGSSIKRSVLWNNNFIAPGVSLRGCVLGSRVQVQAGSNIYEGAVIGSDSVIRERCVINPDVKLWPHKVVETGSTVRESMIWGNRVPRRIFGIEGITGMLNVEITPEFASRVAAAYASTLGEGARVCVSSDIYTPSRMIKDAITCGLMSAGIDVLNISEGITPMHRFAMQKYGCDGGVHVRISPRRPERINILFTNSQGGNISRSQERKIENLLAREDFKRADFSTIREAKPVPDVPIEYIKSLLRKVDIHSIRKARLSIAAIYDRNNSGRFLEPLCNELNVALEQIEVEQPLEFPLNWSNYRLMAEKVATIVIEKGHSMGIILDSGGDYMVLIDNLGRIIQEDLLVALSALTVMHSRGGSVVVPVTAPRAIDILASKYDVRVVRTKTAVQDFYDKLIQEDNLSISDSEGHISQSMIHFDALAAIINIFEYLIWEQANLSETVDKIPSFFMEKKETGVPWEAKGTVIRSLIEEMPEEKMELQDGVKVYHRNGWALVLPDPEEPVCRVFSEGSTMEIAESLADFYIDKIQKIIDPAKKTG